MAERSRRRRLAFATLAFATLASACGRSPAPTPAFARAEVVHRVEGGSACAACRPRAGEQTEACHLGSLEPALLAHREALGDVGVRRDAMVCLYRRQP